MDSGSAPSALVAGRATLEPMPKRSSTEPSFDPNRLAARIVAESTGQKHKKNPHAVALGRKGGKVGGKARALKLTAQERRAIAKAAAEARWAKK